MLVPGGQAIVIGTPFHANDLYGDLKTKKGWFVIEYPAIFPDGRSVRISVTLWIRKTRRVILFSVGKIFAVQLFLTHPSFRLIFLEEV